MEQNTIRFSRKDSAQFSKTLHNRVNDYFKENKLYTTHEPDSICFLGPGAIAWKSDLDTLQQLSEGKEASGTLGSVVAKYFINNDRESN